MLRAGKTCRQSQQRDRWACSPVRGPRGGRNHRRQWYSLSEPVSLGACDRCVELTRSACSRHVLAVRVPASAPTGLASIPHQPRESHPSRLHQIQPTRTGFMWRLSAVWRVLGTITPKSRHIAQIYHLIWHSLNAGTSRHTGRHGQRDSLYPPVPSREPIPSSSPVRRPVRVPAITSHRAHPLLYWPL